jgi:predicted helicase
MAADRDWKRAVRSCLYRPFDHRKVYWTGWMIDWPRQEVMRHMLDGRNLALIVRRQTPPSQPCTYFWVCDDIALDGVIRSDNRGSESLFPLYLNADGPAAPSAAATHPGRRVNLAPEFVELLGSSLSLQWRADGKGDLRSSLGPEDVAHLFYAQFHSPTYRQRYADWLRADFPRVFIPASASLFRALCRLGAKLMAAHLLRSGEAAGPNETSSGSACAAAGSLVAPGYPKHALSRAYVNDAAYFDGVSSDAWDYHVGGYQVLRKWLKDRQGRTLTAAEAACYRQIVAAVTLTQSQMAKIDRVIKQHGGWPGAFLPR